MRSPAPPAAAPRAPPPESTSPRARFRLFLQASCDLHAVAALDGVLGLSEALDDFAVLAAGRGRVAVVVGAPELERPGGHVVPEADMRSPAEFVARLDRVLAHHARPRALPMLAFAPSPACIQPWMDVEALLAARGAEASPRLCIAPSEAMPSLGPAGAELLAQRHTASLRF